jgi:guanidinopropionase
MGHVIQPIQRGRSMSDDLDFTPVDPAVVPRFADIATFMRTRRHDIGAAVDIGLVGVPFDIGLNYRSGARQGPAGVREASRVIRRVHPSSGIRPFEICNVADLGDAPVNPMNKDLSLELIQGFFADLHRHDILPIAIGGDHTIPLPILRALAAERPVGVLHFDAHADTLDELCGDRFNHATFLRRGFEEGLVDPARVIQVGLRGSRFDDDDIQFGYDAGYSIITMDEYEDMGRAAVIRRIDEVLGQGPVYISLDIDGLDPAFLPGTGVPEIGGITPRDAQVILRSLRGRQIVGADISEVSPCFDPTGITCVTVANLMFEMLCVMAAWKSGAR